MLAHLQLPIQVAYGTHMVQANWLMKLILPLFKKTMYNEKPWKKGLPTDKSFIMTGKAKDFEKEKKHLIDLIEQCGSSPVYSLLKREDEKYVTEQAYENPKFVEDMVREVTQKLSTVDAITWFSVAAENFESIHKHSAYARIERDRRQ